MTFRAGMSTQVPEVDQLPGYTLTTRYPNANYRIYKYSLSIELVVNRAKFNIVGLYKLPLHLAEPLLYTKTGTFLNFSYRVPKMERQTDATYFLSVDTPKMVTSIWIPVGNRDPGTKSLPVPPLMTLFPIKNANLPHSIWLCGKFVRL